MNSELSDKTIYKEILDTLDLILDFISKNRSDFAELNNFLQNILARLGAESNADRVYILIFHSNQTMFSNTHEWCAPGIKPFKNELQHQRFAKYGPGFFEILLEGYDINYPKVSEMPPEANQFQEELEREGIVSILNVPIIARGSAIGSLGFDMVKKPREWSNTEIRLYEIVAKVLGFGLNQDDIEYFVQNRSDEK